MSESITITLTSNNHQSHQMFDNWVGEAIRVKDMKRTWAVVTKQENQVGQFTITTIWKYKPAPKSTLNRKSVFSKFKQPII